MNTPTNGRITRGQVPWRRSEAVGGTGAMRRPRPDCHTISLLNGLIPALQQRARGQESLAETQN